MGTVRNMKVSFQIASDLRNLEKGIFVMRVYLSSKDGDGCPKTQRSSGPMWSMLETDLVTNKQKKKEDQIEMFEKIRKKRKNKKIMKLQRGITAGDAVKENPASNTFDVPDFIDLSYWKRCVICCGVIYRGECGEVMVDQRYFRRCSPHT